MRRICLTALLALSWALAAAPAVSAAGDVSLSIQGAGSVLLPDDSVWPCEVGLDDRAPPVDCEGTQQVSDPDTLRLEAVPAPAGHWEFDRWDGSGCVAAPIPPEPEEVCLIPGFLLSGPANPIAVFDDVAGPTIDPVEESRAPDDRRDVTFAFAADEPATFRCRLDDGALEPCDDGRVTYADLAPGAHRFVVQGTDMSGNPGAEVSVPFSVESEPAVVPPPVVQPPVIRPPTIPPLARILGPNAVTAKVSRKRGLALGKVRLTCPAVVAPCRAAVVLRGRLAKGRKPAVIARRSLSLRPSSSATPRLKLTRKAAKALTKRRRLRAVASIAVEAPNATTSKDVAVTLRAPAPPKKKRRARR